MFLLAYGRIYSNAGAMTPGVTGETVDGMSLAKIDTIIGALRSETYRWSPTRRVYVPKKDGRRRPIGMPPWSDKIVAEVVRLLLEAYYNVRFSDHSHGFRPERGCHTALREVANTWTGTTWFVEGDLADYFGSLDHEILLSTLAEQIHDGRFLQLIDRMLKAGYLEDWRWNATLSGAPQGGVASPILSNIYLDRFDQWVEQQLIPEYNVGKRRRPNPAYQWANSKIRTATRKGDKEKVRALRRERRSLPSLDPYDPGYRRLRYVRYCDDFLLGFAGPKAEAEEIKEKARAFLRDELRLELSEPKTLITHAASHAARFLGYEIRTQRADTKITRGRRMVNGKIGLFVPRDVIRKRCARYTKHGKPAMRGVLLHDEDFTIVAKYGSEYRGFVQYYLLAQDVYRLGPLHRVMELSLLKTLARKHRSTATKMARKYKAVTMTADGPRACFQVTVQRDRGRKPLTARFGGIPLHQQRTTAIADIKPTMATVWGNELIRRLLAGQCEMCESRVGLQVHHIRKLADLKKPGRSEPSIWVRVMAQRRRKTLVVCATCHHDIHAGRATATTRK
ncbi:maturase [Streptomyces rapamycinicus]|uniref:Maturase n=1 Tax=Streptomyces rhizosphaericus TaxID=114699 RepID=A0A6G4AIP3_9ACTN|nr:maturase [Streptomyces rhizosphaericus]